MAKTNRMANATTDERKTRERSSCGGRSLAMTDRMNYLAHRVDESNQVEGASEKCLEPASMAKAIVSHAAHTRSQTLVPSPSRLHDPCSMRLIAPTAFKGTMSPLQAAQHFAGPGDRLLPLSDEATASSSGLQHGLGGEINHAPGGGSVWPHPSGASAVTRRRHSGSGVRKVIGLGRAGQVGPAQCFSRGLAICGALSACVPHLARAGGQRHSGRRTRLGPC